MNPYGAKGGARQRRSGERGSAAVEAAIVTPLVMALLFGIVELGFLFKDYLAAAGAVRAGVRIASANPRNATFAQIAADKVAQSGGAMNLNDVQKLWVYQVNPSTAAQDWQDKPIGFGNFLDCTVCVKFYWDPVAKKFGTPNINGWPALDQNACSTSSLSGPPDRIGVYLELKHDAFTGLVFNTVTISEASILSLEPSSFVTGCKKS